MDSNGIDLKALHQRAVDRMFKDSSVVKNLVNGTTASAAREAIKDSASHGLLGFSMPKGMSTGGKTAAIVAAVGLTTAGAYALFHKPKDKSNWVAKEDARRAANAQQTLSV